MKKIKAFVLAAAFMASASIMSPVSAFAEESVISDVAVSSMCKGTDNTLYFVDTEHNVVYEKSASDTKIVAGVSGKTGYVDGKTTQALFSSPWDITAYQQGFAISDTENHVIRFMKNGKVKTIAGTGRAGWTDRKGKKAAFSRPTGLAVGDKGELYIADTGNNCIRVMYKSGKVTTFAGTQKGCTDGKLKKARFKEPTGLFYKSGVLYVADSGNHRICQIKNGKVKTIAGSSKGIEGDALGKPKQSRFSNPQEICYYKEALYIADTGNGSIKKLKDGTVTKEIEEYSMQDGLLPSAPRGLCVDKGYLYIGDIYADQLIRVEL